MKCPKCKKSAEILKEIDKSIILCMHCKEVYKLRRVDGLLKVENEG